MPAEVLDGGARKRRIAASAIALVLLLIGTFRGLDDHFPFGPFRMYATRDEVDGPVRSLLFEATDDDGNTFTIGSNSLGLRRAEADGQVERVRRDPDFLRYFVEAYEAFHPGDPPLVHFRLFHRIYELKNREPVRRSEETIAEWTSASSRE